MQSTIDRYLLRLEAEGKSHHTLNAYRHDLEAFSQSVEGMVVGEIETDHISDHIIALRRSGRAGTSVNRAISSIKGLFGWAYDEGIIGADPSASIRTKRAEPESRITLTADEKTKLLKELRLSKDRDALRDLAMIHLMLSTGIRLSELVGLDLDDVVDEKHIRVTAKGGKHQVKFLGAAIRGTMRLYLKWRSRLEIECKAIFIGRGDRISCRQVQNRLEHWCVKSGIKVVSPHALRHTFATDLLDSSGNLHLVQKALGHSRIETTTIYTHLGDQQIAEALEGF